MEAINFNGKFLYEESGSYFIRDKSGQIKKIPKNKFYSGQIVSSTTKHFSPKEFTRVINPSWTVNRGWVYTENYIDRQGSGGGCGCWIEENLFQEITDPTDLLLVERIKLKKEHAEIKKRLDIVESSLEKISFALDLSVPEHETITDRCDKCKSYFGKEYVVVRGSRACAKCNS